MPSNLHQKTFGATRVISLIALPCLVLALSGCGSASSYRTRTTRRGPVWVVPTAAAVSTTPSFVPMTATYSPQRAGTNHAPSIVAPSNAPAAALKANAPPPVANVLSVANLKEMAAKGVDEQTILNALRASRAIYTLTTKDVTELLEAKVSRAVIDYLLSTPLLYKDDLLRSRANYYYWPSYPDYWRSSFYDFHHDLHHYEPPHSYGHHDTHSGGLHH